MEMRRFIVEQIKEKETCFQVSTEEAAVWGLECDGSFGGQIHWSGWLSKNRFHLCPKSTALPACVTLRVVCIVRVCVGVCMWPRKQAAVFIAPQDGPEPWFPHVCSFNSCSFGISESRESSPPFKASHAYLRYSCCSELLLPLPFGGVCSWGGQSVSVIPP